MEANLGFLGDREALIKAAVSGTGKFFLGSDSAPHDISKKKGGTGKTAAGVRQFAPISPSNLSEILTSPGLHAAIRNPTGHSSSRASHRKKGNNLRRSHRGDPDRLPERPWAEILPCSGHQERVHRATEWERDSQGVIHRGRSRNRALQEVTEHMEHRVEAGITMKIFNSVVTPRLCYTTRAYANAGKCQMQTRKQDQ